MKSIDVIGLPALTDSYENYIWLLIQNQEVYVIDPSEAEPVQEYLAEHALSLKGILITHMHHDHVAGVAALQSIQPDLPIWGGCHNPFQLINQRVQEGDSIALWPNYTLNVLATPGHTEEHISFYNQQHLFCGDTLFTAGAGRILNRGTAEQYHQSIQKLLQLPDELGFFCAHEYTQSNLEFALIADPDNLALQQRQASTHIDYPKIQMGALSTLGLEKRTNPFMRYQQDPLKSQLQQRGAKDSGSSRFAALREWKDQFDRGEL